MQNNNRKRKDLRQILKEPKLKHKNNPVGQETDSTQCETFGLKNIKIIPYFLGAW
jgi:hypothetical protein